MKEWRVPIVLLAIIVLLGVILGVKIMKNTSNKQIAEVKNNYNVINKEDINEEDISQEDRTMMIVNEVLQRPQETMRRRLELEEKKELFETISVLVIIVSSYILFYKMDIDSELIKKSIIVLVGAIFIRILLIVWLVLYIKLLLKAGEEMEISTWMCFVPFVLLWKLGEYFEKGIIFKLGLMLLPMVFFPILALTIKHN